MSFKMIVGLGNPGRQYEETRHNVGFMVLDRLAADTGTPFESAPKWQCHTAKLPDGTLLVKPQTFMNLSGRAIRQILSFHKLGSSWAVSSGVSTSAAIPSQDSRSASAPACRETWSATSSGNFRPTSVRCLKTRLPRLAKPCSLRVPKGSPPRRTDTTSAFHHPNLTPMSRKYQGLIILNTNSLEGSVDELVTAISKELEAEGAKLEKITNLGRRQFAYNARHLEAGHYINYLFDGAADVVARIQSRLKLNTRVHQQHFQRVA